MVVIHLDGWIALPRGYKGVVIVLHYMKNMCDWTQVQVLRAVGNGECPTWCECVGTSEAVLKGSKQSRKCSFLVHSLFLFFFPFGFPIHLYFYFPALHLV